MNEKKIDNTDMKLDLSILGATHDNNIIILKNQWAKFQTKQIKVNSLNFIDNW